MKFTKMHGLGNDYVYVNGFVEELSGVDEAELARRISDRHRGVGSDGLIVMRRSERADVRMVMYNADGGRAQMCGNGIRCVAKYALENDLTRANPMRIETDAGVRAARVGARDSGVSAVTVTMGEPIFVPSALPARFEGTRMQRESFSIRGRELEVSCISIGNPHAVIFVSDLGEIDVARDGGALETDDHFPEGINVHFARIERAGEVTMQSWERGSGATQACGTGACAVAVLAETSWPVRVHLPGGDLTIDRVCGDEAGGAKHAELVSLARAAGDTGDPLLLMTGPAETVFEGNWRL
jgi:diaminopimelate epimerase